MSRQLAKRQPRAVIRAAESAVWFTRDGGPVKIRQMSTQHLLATIHFIERNRFTALDELGARWADGERLDLETFGHYADFPTQYDDLIAEAQYRKVLKRY